MFAPDSPAILMVLPRVAKTEYVNGRHPQGASNGVIEVHRVVGVSDHTGSPVEKQVRRNLL